MIINIKKIAVLLFKSKEVLKLLIINNEIQILEGNEIYEREYLTRGARRTCIQIEIPKQDNVTYETLADTFVDGVSIVRRLTETRIEPTLVTEATETEEAVYEDKEVEYTNDYPLSDFVVAGDIIYKRDGTFTVYMGKKTSSEILEEENAELLLTLGGEI